MFSYVKNLKKSDFEKIIGALIKEKINITKMKNFEILDDSPYAKEGATDFFGINLIGVSKKYGVQKYFINDYYIRCSTNKQINALFEDKKEQYCGLMFNALKQYGSAKAVAYKKDIKLIGVFLKNLDKKKEQVKFDNTAEKSV